MNSAIYYNTFHPYKEIEHTGIDYTVCRAFDHISRYRGLRQVVHDPDSFDRFITLEIQNAFSTNSEIEYYEVPRLYTNRLDLLSKKFYGSAHYGWIIAYMNGIQDGYTVHEGQRIKYLKNFTDLFNNGELLAAIPAMQLNLGSE
jgi:hypothetical protein